VSRKNYPGDAGGKWIEDCYEVLVRHRPSRGIAIEWPVNVWVPPLGPTWAADMWDAWPPHKFSSQEFVEVCWAIKQGGDLPAEEAAAAFLSAYRLGGYAAGAELLAGLRFRVRLTTSAVRSSQRRV